jgi:hypothetical protein
MGREISKNEIEIVAGVVGPEWVTDDDLAIPTPDGGLRLAVRVDFDKQLNRYVVGEFRIFRDENAPGIISTEVLRSKFTVAEWEAAVLYIPTPVIRELPNPDRREPWGLHPPDDVRDAPTRRGLAWTAHLYRYAVAVGLSPTKAVEDTLGLKRSTASYWIAKAREPEFAYLPHAEPGKVRA